jgi:hypothetical protein
MSGSSQLPSIQVLHYSQSEPDSQSSVCVHMLYILFIGR